MAGNTDMGYSYSPSSPGFVGLASVWLGLPSSVRLASAALFGFSPARGNSASI